MNWKFWIHSLIAAFVGGAANTITVMIVDPVAFNLNDVPKLLKVALVSGVFSVALLLKKSPLPDVPADIAKVGAIAFLLLIPSGCAIKPGTVGPVSVSTNGVVSVFGGAINPATVKTDLTVAARAGAIAAIRYDANAKAYLQAALGVIQAALDESDYDPTNITVSLQTISIKEAHDPNIIEGVNDVMELYQAHFGDVVSAKLDKNLYLRPMLEGIRDGLQQAIN